VRFRLDGLVFFARFIVSSLPFVPGLAGYKFGHRAGSKRLHASNLSLWGGSPGLYRGERFWMEAPAFWGGSPGLYGRGERAFGF